jgi:hypothetical protein
LVKARLERGDLAGELFLLCVVGRELVGESLADTLLHGGRLGLVGHDSTLLLPGMLLTDATHPNGPVVAVPPDCRPCGVAAIDRL